MMSPVYSYGNSLVTFDPIAERKLRRKMDFYTVPTVAILYLFCVCPVLQKPP